MAKKPSLYIVYAYAPPQEGDPMHGFDALRIDKLCVKLTDHFALTAIRNFEVESPSIDYAKKPCVGSFNYAVIKTNRGYEYAIAKARKNKLMFEPMEVCRARYLEKHPYRKSKKNRALTV